MILTIIYTYEPATGKTMSRPACEMYRTIEQAQRNVLRREYESGISTWLAHYTISAHSAYSFGITPVADLF